MENHYSNDVNLIQALQMTRAGIVNHFNARVPSKLEFHSGSNSYLLLIGDILEFDTNGIAFSFENHEQRLKINATITDHKNSIKIEEKLISQHTECKIYSFEQHIWTEESAYYRSFFYSSDRLIYDITGSPRGLNLVVNGILIKLYHAGGFLIIENDADTTYDVFSEIRYPPGLSLPKDDLNLTNKKQDSVWQ